MIGEAIKRFVRSTTDQQNAEALRAVVRHLREERDAARDESWRLREQLCSIAGRPVTGDDVAAWCAAHRVRDVDVARRNLLLERCREIMGEP